MNISQQGHYENRYSIRYTETPFPCTLALERFSIIVDADMLMQGAGLRELCFAIQSLLSCVDARAHAVVGCWDQQTLLHNTHKRKAFPLCGYINDVAG